MAEADEPDRLSQLPDELLHHILELAPCREAESTAVLSRRWRGLWPPPPPTCAAVKIEIPSIDSDGFHRRRRDAALRGAKEALAAAQGRPVRRLSIHVGDECEFVDIVVGEVLSYRASRGVQDLRIFADDSRQNAPYICKKYNDNDDTSWSWPPDHLIGEFQFSFGSMASTALRLRVLHITNCKDLTPSTPRGISFPCLEVLRLRKCNVHLERLQDMVVASPQLAALQLEYVFISTEIRGSPSPPSEWREDEWRHRYYNRSDGYYYNFGDDFHRRNEYLYFPQSLCCPGITTLVLLNCGCERDYVVIELDVPRVQHFRFRGRIDQFTLRSPLSDVRRVYLHFLDFYSSGDETCKMFWNFLKNFGGTKVMKLNVKWPIDDVASLEWETIFRELLGETMFDVEHLEIDARHKPASKDAAVAIGNLLQCCPVIRDLRIKLKIADQRRPRGRREGCNTFVQNKAQKEFYKSIDHFKHRRDRPVIPLRGDDDKVSIVSDIPGLSNRWLRFRCLRYHLRSLSLQFQMGKPDCVGIQLAKFFVERGMVLEEMYIDDGNTRLWEHTSCKISGYVAGPRPCSEHHVLARLSPALSMNQFSSSKISGWSHHRKLVVRRTHPWSAVSRSFTISPLADA